MAFLREFKFWKIPDTYNELYSRNNDTPKKVFEFEIYSLMYSLLDVLNAFETGQRKPLVDGDYNELLQKLKFAYNTLKGNIKYLENSED